MTRPVDGLRRLIGHRVVLSVDDGRVVDGELSGLDGEWLVMARAAVVVGGSSVGVDGQLFVARARVVTIQVA